MMTMKTLSVIALLSALTIGSVVADKASLRSPSVLRKVHTKKSSNESSRREGVSLAAAASGETDVETMYEPGQTFGILQEAGAGLQQLDSKSLFFRALAAGMLVGFGGVLTTSVGFDMGSPPAWMPGQGMARFLSGAVGFPLTIIMVTMSGQGAWTVDTFLSTLAFSKGKSSMNNFLRTNLVTYLGCLVGTSLVAALATVGALPMITPCIELADHKLSMNMIQTLARGIGGGALICMAVFMAKACRTMSGKVLSIWFPISTYVICDFEHCLATMFFLFTAKLNGHDMTMSDFWKTIIPGTIGNFIGGAMMIGMGLANIPKTALK